MTQVSVKQGRFLRGDVLAEGRKSVRHRIAHYEFVSAGCINLTARGFFLVGIVMLRPTVGMHGHLIAVDEWGSHATPPASPESEACVQTALNGWRTRFITLGETWRATYLLELASPVRYAASFSPRCEAALFAVQF